MGSEINIFLTHYGFPMNINGLGLDFQSSFSGILEPILNEFESFLVKARGWALSYAKG